MELFGIWSVICGGTIGLLCVIAGLLGLMKKVQNTEIFLEDLNMEVADIKEWTQKHRHRKANDEGSNKTLTMGTGVGEQSEF